MSPVEMLDQLNNGEMCGETTQVPCMPHLTLLKCLNADFLCPDSLNFQYHICCVTKNKNFHFIKIHLLSP